MNIPQYCYYRHDYLFDSLWIKLSNKTKRSLNHAKIATKLKRSIKIIVTEKHFAVKFFSLTTHLELAQQRIETTKSKPDDL